MSGGGKISLSLGGSKKTKPAPTNGVKRSHAALQDGEEDENVHGQAQTVSHFDKAAGGAIDEAHQPKKEEALVIAPQANRDWREASQRNKRQKVPLELQQSSNAAEIEARDQAKKPTVGLNIKKKEQNGETEEENGAMDVDEAQQAPPDPKAEAPVAARTDDELAMDALLGKTKKSDLVLPAITEDEAFERDIHSAPDMATLDDYARVPVEQFGAALLRGMGWKEGEGIGSQRGQKVTKTKVPERRPALLGIGAKEEAAVKEEMGAWGRGARGGKGRGEVKVYNPVLLRDKRTGEMFTEEEAEKRKVRAEQERYELEFEREEAEKAKRRGDDSRDRDRDRGLDKKEKERRKDDRYRDRRRDDDEEEEKYIREKERRRRREQERSESDDERARRKEKERRRRDRERDDRDYDVERKKRHGGDRERVRRR